MSNTKTAVQLSRGESVAVHVKGYPDILVTANNGNVEVVALQNNARLFVGPTAQASQQRRRRPARVTQINARRKAAVQKTAAAQRAAA